MPTEPQPGDWVSILVQFGDGEPEMLIAAKRGDVLPAGSEAWRPALAGLLRRAALDVEATPGVQVVTAADVARYPEYFINGPGREAAHGARCEHGYRLTDSCPCCP